MTIENTLNTYTAAALYNYEKTNHDLHFRGIVIPYISLPSWLFSIPMLIGSEFDGLSSHETDKTNYRSTKH